MISLLCFIIILTPRLFKTLNLGSKVWLKRQVVLQPLYLKYLHCLHNTLSLANPSLENLEIKVPFLSLSSQKYEYAIKVQLCMIMLLSMLTTSRKSATTQCHCSHIAEKAQSVLYKEREKRRSSKKGKSCLLLLLYFQHIFCMFPKWAKIVLNQPVLFV